MTEVDDGVTTIELFFDLVFVFTITQLTRVVADDPTVAGVVRSMLIFGNLWWMYGGYVWLTNTVPPTGNRERMLLLAGMGGFLVAALGIPNGFGSGGIVLGVGYLVVNVIHGWLLLGRMEGSVFRAMGRLGPVNLATATLVLVAGFTPLAATWVLWSAAFVLHWATPYLTNPAVVTLRSRHFVERHGLIVLIALGESVFAVGATVNRDGIATVQLLAALCALVIVAALWWLYFDHDDAAAVRVFDATDGTSRSWLALHAYGYAFMPLLGGVIIFAAGLQRGIGNPDRRAPVATATLVASGIMAYAVGLLAVRVRLRLGPIGVRAAIAVLCLPTILLGTRVSLLAQLVAVGILLIGAALLARRHDAVRATNET